MVMAHLNPIHLLKRRRGERQNGFSYRFGLGLLLVSLSILPSPLGQDDISRPRVIRRKVSLGPMVLGVVVLPHPSHRL